MLWVIDWWSVSVGGVDGVTGCGDEASSVFRMCSWREFCASDLLVERIFMFWFCFVKVTFFCFVCRSEIYASVSICGVYNVLALVLLVEVKWLSLWFCRWGEVIASVLWVGWSYRLCFTGMHKLHALVSLPRTLSKTIWNLPALYTKPQRVSFRRLSFKSATQNTMNYTKLCDTTGNYHT